MSGSSSSDSHPGLRFGVRVRFREERDKGEERDGGGEESERRVSRAAAAKVILAGGEMNESGGEDIK